MKLTICKIIIIICIIAMSFLFYKNLQDVNGKIANQDIVLDLIDSHDRYHEIYMKQFEGVHSRSETAQILSEVYLNDSYKIVKPQIQVGNKTLKTKEDMLDCVELNEYGLYTFTYRAESDVIIVEPYKELKENGND